MQLKIASIDGSARKCTDHVRQLGIGSNSWRASTWPYGHRLCLIRSQCLQRVPQAHDRLHHVPSGGGVVAYFLGASIRHCWARLKTPGTVNGQRWSVTGRVHLVVGECICGAGGTFGSGRDPCGGPCAPPLLRWLHKFWPERLGAGPRRSRLRLWISVHFVHGAWFHE